MNKRKEDRLVVINEYGVLCEIWNIKIFEDIQDDGKTLKLFIRTNSDNYLKDVEKKIK